MQIPIFVKRQLPFGKLVCFCLIGGLLLSFANGQTLADKAHSIYYRLQSALKYGPADQLPRLELVPQKTKGAGFSIESNLIWLDHLLIQEIENYFSPREAEAMLAFLIGHELGHFHEQNSCESLCLIRYPGAQPGRTESVDRELRADYFGGFSSYLAKLDTGFAYVRLFDLLYQIYPEAASYPSKQERRNQARQVQQRIRELIQVFRLGNLLSLSADYLGAVRCYQEVLRDFRSRELYHNLASTHLLCALDHAPKGAFPWAFPIELDPFIRLMPDQRKPISPKLSVFQHHLQQAGAYLQQGRQQDPQYVRFFYLEACLALLNRKPSLALEWVALAPARSRQHVQQEAIWRWIEGLARASLGQSEQATACFQEMLDAALPEPIQGAVRYNLDHLLGQPQPMAEDPPYVPGPWASFRRERHALLRTPCRELEHGACFHWHRTQDLELFHWQGRRMFVLMQSPQGGDTGIGMPLTQIRSRYGKLRQPILWGEDAVYLAWESATLFWVDHQGVVRQIAYFRDAF